MKTSEHIALGDALKVKHHGNPYMRRNKTGQMEINLHHLDERNLPEPVNLWMTVGEIIAAGDFLKLDWINTLDLPPCGKSSNAQNLGEYLIEKRLSPEEEGKLYEAYAQLASPDVKQEDINRVLSIATSKYIPFSEALNGYVQQLALYLRVNNYRHILNNNHAHFAPWALRAYILGHHQALQFATATWYLKKLAQGKSIAPPNAFCEKLHAHLDEMQHDPEKLEALAHHYHALAVGMEWYSDHFLTDHFNYGHMSPMGDLRVLLPEKFGTLGGILVNDFHNEMNRNGGIVHPPYAPDPEPDAPAIPAYGDGKVDDCRNAFNKAACIAGMQASLDEVENALKKGKIPDKEQYAALSFIMDVDPRYAQQQPLFVLNEENTIYRRKSLRKTQLLAPSDYEAMEANPAEHGYQPLKSKWDAFGLVLKLRVFPFIFKGKKQAVSDAYLEKIKAEEAERNPGRDPIPTPPCTPKASRKPGTPGKAPETPHPSPANYGLFTRNKPPSPALNVANNPGPSLS